MNKKLVYVVENGQFVPLSIDRNNLLRLTPIEEQPTDLTRREYFAGMALSGLIAGEESYDINWVSARAIEHADALIKALDAKERIEAEASPGNADCQHSEVILTNEGKRLECLLCTASRNFAVSPFAVDTDKP